ncbi:MAG: DUF192 domain-containing protein [Planctomycetota bacterium]
MPTQLLRWTAKTDGRVLAQTVRVADSYWKRLVGLQFAKSMPLGEVLWLKKVRSIHTACMRFPIDVIFLDESLTILQVQSNVRPWRIASPTEKATRHVLERRYDPENIELVIGEDTVIDVCADSTRS